MADLSTSSNGLERFPQLCIRLLDQFALQKKRKTRGNNIYLFNKFLGNAHKR